MLHKGVRLPERGRENVLTSNVLVGVFRFQFLLLQKKISLCCYATFTRRLFEKLHLIHGAARKITFRGSAQNVRIRSLMFVHPTQL